MKNTSTHKTTAQSIRKILALSVGALALNTILPSIAAAQIAPDADGSANTTADCTTRNAPLFIDGFFVPKDCEGKVAYMEGTAFYDTTSVDDLRHYAVDGGMSEEEAAKTNRERQYDHPPHL